MANAMGAERFAHPQTATEVILKTRLLEKEGDNDRVSVTALSFAAENREDFIPVLGGDGRMHAVPVPWVEYIPVENSGEISIRRVPASMLECQKLRHEGKISAEEIFFHGMAGRVI